MKHSGSSENIEPAKTVSFYPPRPTVTDEMIRTAAAVIAKQLNGNAESIVEVYSHPMDGYELGKELEKWHWWDVSREDINILDEMDSTVESALRKAEKEWVENNNIQPLYPNGTALKEGVIEGVCEYTAARYLVKEHGCTQDKQWRLIPFEDAVLQCEVGE